MPCPWTRHCWRKFGPLASPQPSMIWPSVVRSSMSQWCYMVLYESKWFLMILVIFTYDSMYVYHCLSVILCDSLMLPWSFYLHRHIHLPGDQQMAAVCFEPSLWTTQTREVSLDLLTCLAKGDSERPVALVALRKIMMIGSLRLIKSGIESPCNQVSSSSLCKMMWLHIAINRWGILWCWWHAKCYLQQQTPQPLCTIHTCTRCTWKTCTSCGSRIKSRFPRVMTPMMSPLLPFQKWRKTYPPFASIRTYNETET